MEQTMIRVFVADDHSIIQEGLEKLINEETDMKVVGYASNAIEVNEYLISNTCDIIILDISMPGKTGLEVLDDIVKKYKQTRVLILSMHPSERFAIRCFKLGAYGYLNKNTDVSNIVKAIRTIYSGKKYITNDLANSIVLNFNDNNDLSTEKLSNQEFQVFLKLATGKSVTETAQELSLSQSTINTYRTRIFEKMELKSNMDLVYFAIKNNITE